MESIPWWKSEGIVSEISKLAASFVAFIVAVGLIFGVHIDPITQGYILGAFLAFFALVISALSFWGIVSRRNTNTVIQGSRGEKALIDAGVAVVPHANGGSPESVAASMAASQPAKPSP